MAEPDTLVNNQEEIIVTVVSDMWLGPSQQIP